MKKGLILVLLLFVVLGVITPTLAFAQSSEVRLAQVQGGVESLWMSKDGDGGGVQLLSFSSVRIGLRYGGRFVSSGRGPEKNEMWIDYFAYSIHGNVLTMEVLERVIYNQHGEFDRRMPMITPADRFGFWLDSDEEGLFITVGSETWLPNGRKYRLHAR